MAKTFTTQELADLFGLTPTRILQIAKARAVKPSQAGSPRHPAIWPASAKAALKPGLPGRPRKVAK